MELGSLSSSLTSSGFFWVFVRVLYLLPSSAFLFTVFKKEIIKLSLPHTLQYFTYKEQMNALKHVEYHIRNESPVQVRCRIQDDWGWCTGTTQRDGMAREVGGGFSMGNTCTPVVDSCRCMAKPIQYCKVISL